MGVVARDASRMVLGFYQVVIDGIRDPETNLLSEKWNGVTRWDSPEFMWKGML